MPVRTRRLPRWFRPRRVFSHHTPRQYSPSDAAITVIVEPDDFSVIVEEEGMEYADYYSLETLADENGETLVDENGETLVVTEVNVGMVYVVRVPPDDFSVIVEEET